MGVQQVFGGRPPQTNTPTSMNLSKLTLLTGLVLASSSGQQFSCKCGQKKEEPSLGVRVVGGGDALANEFPWAAHIIIRSDRRISRCGGSLINDRFVLTAAHCVEESNLSINVTLGEHDVNIKEGIEFRTRVKRFGYDIHNSYSNKPKEGIVEYDVALLELEKPGNFDEYKHIRPICLPSGDNIDYAGKHKIGIVAGWGATTVDYSTDHTGVKTGEIDPNSASAVLKKLTDVQILGFRECDEILYKYEMVTKRKAKLRSSNICGHSETGDSCVGDSGSGLVAWNQEKRAFELIGVVSFGIIGCNSSLSDTKLPGVYTRVSETVSWIKGKSEEGMSCGGERSPAQPQTPPPVGWAQWSEFTTCQGTGKIGKKERNRRCRDGTGKSCKRLLETQERRCFL